MDAVRQSCGALKDPALGGRPCLSSRAAEALSRDLDDAVAGRCWDARALEDEVVSGEGSDRLWRCCAALLRFT